MRRHARLGSAVSPLSTALVAAVFGLFGVGSASALATPPPAPATGPKAADGFEAASFFSGGKQHALYVDREHVAVRRSAQSSQRRQRNLSEREVAAFTQIGVDLIARTAVRSSAPQDVIVGYPIWFDREKAAVGVLTHEIIVRVEDGREAAALATLRRSAGFADMAATTFRKGLYLAKFTSPMAALDAANQLYGKGGIRYAHPNFILPKDFRSRPESEPLYRHQWHLENQGQGGGTVGADIGVRAAWDVTTGTSERLVAVLDGGFETSHPDLTGSWYVNSGEIPSNGIDDDGNGYIDDSSGWNFWSKGPNPATGVLDDHGTAVAGLVGARVNGRGMTGVCPQCRMLPIVVSWDVAEDAAAFYYAASRGAEIITNSWGYPLETPLTDVVKEAIDTVAATGRDGKGTIILFAMNNIDQDDCIGARPDISSLDSVVAVSGASDHDRKVSFSAWGDCMEFLSPTYEAGRPGVSTTDVTGSRGYNNGRYPGDLPDLDYTNDFGGTSAATPIAAGVFALMLSVNPDLTRDEALAIVLATADKVHPDLAAYDPRTGFSRKYGYGRINAGKAVRAAQVFKKYTKRDRPAHAGGTVLR